MCSINIEFINRSAGSTNRLVLSDISLKLEPESVNVMLGESGCGKTTLLRIILGLIKPISVKVLINGKDYFSMTPKEFRQVRQNFGVLFQDGALLGSLTLADNVALPLTEHTNLSRKLLKESAIRCLELVGLKDFANYYPSEISGGMRKKAALARAIIREPAILLCDEPTSGLDPITSAQMDQLLLDMKGHSPKMSILSVSHDLASMQRIEDNVLLLQKGHVAFYGNKED